MTELTDAKDRLTSDMSLVIRDIEELLSATANTADAQVTQIRARLRDRLTAARQSLSEAQGAVVERSKAFAHSTDDYVHQHPWTAIGVSAGVGLLLGVLIGRR
jgi:ElaB/YqjD/DUF883 family membrane-anchored ribosome-binding protein